MTKLILIFGLLLFFVNTIFGVLLSDYLPLNCLLVDAVLLTNTLFLYKISSSQINNGFKVSLSFVFLLLGIISTVLATLGPEKWKDNYYLIGFALILFIEISFYLIAKSLKFINTKK